MGNSVIKIAAAGSKLFIDDMWCFILIVIILIISLLVDVSYYFRLGVMYFMSRFFKKQQELFDTAVVRGKMFLILHSLSVVKEKSTDP